MESYLKGTLEIPGVDLVQKVSDPVLAGYETEAPGIDALASGDIDAFLTAEPVALEAIKEGKAVRLLDEPAFSMYPTGFVDKSWACGWARSSRRWTRSSRRLMPTGRSRRCRSSGSRRTTPRRLASST